MFDRKLNTLLLCLHRKNASLPDPLLERVYEMDIETLLHYVAYGDPDNVKKILDINPGLLLQVATVTDPAGNTIYRHTPLECALGAGDRDMAELIGSYFKDIDDGEKERLRQCEPYKPFIEAMASGKQEPDFDFVALLQSIIAASDGDIDEELKTGDAFDRNHASSLRDALDAFRKHFAPRTIKAGEMHFNYANLQKAFDMYTEQFEALPQSGKNSEKCYLFWRQVIGFVQRGLPACDRQAFAQGIYYIVEKKEILHRSFDFRLGGGSFPIISSSLCIGHSGLGFDYGLRGDVVSGRPLCYSNLISSKSINLVKFMQPHRPARRALCVIC